MLQAAFRLRSLKSLLSLTCRKVPTRMTSPVASIQEKSLAENAATERVYQDLLFFYGAQRALDKIEALASDIDPSNEADYLVFELFQGTDPQALLALAHPDDAPWIRYSLMKAFLQRDAWENTLAFWKKILQWQVPDTLTANTLVQYALQQGRFEEAGNIAAVSLKVAPNQQDVLLWKAMAQSKQVLNAALYLEPLPRQFEVSLALAPAHHSTDVDSMADAVMVQNYPLSEILLANADAALARALAEMAPRPTEQAGGQWWVTGAITACATPLLITVPEGCVPTFDYAQQFLLALENIAPGWSASGGRVEDLHQDKPGDCWRVARMGREFPMERSTEVATLDTNALCLDVASLRTCDTANSTELARHVHEAGRTTQYLPEAVALDLREDTIESALACYWQNQLAHREGEGDFASAAALVTSFNESRERAVDFMNGSIAEGNSTLIYPDFLHFFMTASLDLHEGVQRGLLDLNQAGAIQERLIESLSSSDEGFKRNLRGKIRKSLGARLFPAASAGTLPSDMENALAQVLKGLDTLYRALTLDLYLALIG